jgi:hypothetical protein
MDCDRLVICIIVPHASRWIQQQRRANRRRRHRHRSPWVTHVFGIIALLVLLAVGWVGISQSTDTPLDRVDRSLWPYIHH